MIWHQYSVQSSEIRLRLASLFRWADGLVYSMETGKIQLDNAMSLLLPHLPAAMVYC